MQNRIKNKIKVKEYKPKEDLERFCYALVSIDVKGNKDAAERLSGVDKGKFHWAWNHHPEFREWYTKLCMDILTSNSAIPPYALLGAVVGKDTQAIRLYYELTGQLKNKPLIDASVHNHFVSIKHFIEGQVKTNRIPDAVNR